MRDTDNCDDCGDFGDLPFAASPLAAAMAAGEEAAGESEGGTGVAEPKPAKPKKKPKASRKTKPKKPPSKMLPPYRVLLHDDPDNYADVVAKTIVELTPLDMEEAKRVTIEADQEGVSLVLVTHKERAELYQEQFKSCSLTVTIEPAE